MKRRKFAGVVTLLIAVLVTAGAVNAVGIWRYGLQDDTRHADCAIVPGAGINGSAPSAVFKERLNHAAELYRRGYVKKLILTGGYSKGSDISDAAVARLYMLTRQIPAQDILLEERSRVTRENLRYAREIMTASRLNTALIVSDPLHMKRVMLIAQGEGLQAWSSPTPTTRYRTLRSQLPFLARETFYYSSWFLWRKLRSVFTVQNSRFSDKNRL